MKDIKNIVIEMVTDLTNDLQATANMPCYNNDGILTSDYYEDTEKVRKDLYSKLEILSTAIDAFDFIYYPHNNSIEFVFKFDDFTRRECVEVTNLENYISRF